MHYQPAGPCTEEWDKELDACLDDLTQQDGRAVLGMPDPNAHNFTSWCKLYAVYGENYTHSSARVEGEYTPEGRAVYKVGLHNRPSDWWTRYN